MRAVSLPRFLRSRYALLWGAVPLLSAIAFALFAIDLIGALGALGTSQSTDSPFRW